MDGDLRGYRGALSQYVRTGLPEHSDIMDEAKNMDSRTRRSWLMTMMILVILSNLGALGDDVPPTVKGEAVPSKDEEESTTIAITSLRIYSLDPPPKRQPSPPPQISTTNHHHRNDNTEEIPTTRMPSGNSHFPSMRAYPTFKGPSILEYKRKEQEIVQWLMTLSPKRKRQFYTRIGLCPPYKYRHLCCCSGRNRLVSPPPPPSSLLISDSRNLQPPTLSATRAPELQNIEPTVLTTIPPTMTEMTTEPMTTTTNTPTTTTDIPSTSESMSVVDQVLPKSRKSIASSANVTENLSSTLIEKKRSKCKKEKEGGKTTAVSSSQAPRELALSV